jgi:GTP-binding protein Era
VIVGDAAGQARCGTIAVLGAPNAGKSTLVNALVGSKVSIVTPKVQTTRARITGIAIAGDSQLIFLDTPGIFTPRKTLEKAMVATAWGSAANADLVTVLVDSRRRPGEASDDTAAIIEGLSRSGRKGVLVLNKIDLISRPTLLALTQSMAGEDSPFEQVFMVSALKGDGVADLLAYLAAACLPGPWLYPEDQIADMPERFLAAELTREKLFLALYDELPYSVAVEHENWQERDDGSVRIDQCVLISREAHKPIVLGKGGRRIRDVGTAARTFSESLLDRRVHLFLTVKVREGWTEDPARYREMGLDFPRAR